MNELFFNNLPKELIDNNAELSKFIDELNEYSKTNSKVIYIINKPLVLKDVVNYDYDQAIVILIPNYKISIINLDDNNQLFDYFFDDFISDIETLSQKYNYMKKIGRKRNWLNIIEKKNFKDVFVENFNNESISNFMTTLEIDKSSYKISELIISLLIGSINDIDEININNEETILEKIKHKIILFDGMQSKFIYETLNKKTVTIQGLAGTGKTELLLHKLKEIYVSDKTARIAFTCHNKILSKVMKDRIPNFFNFMKVEEQIEWEKKLWVFNSWGNQADLNSGLYSFICNHYKINFYRYSQIRSFDEVCKLAIKELELKDFEPVFDYVFIDESQDFTDNFFKLCEMVTSKKLFIAGDIFQNIFDTELAKSVSSDYLLNKCYRTEPKTLMLAHSISLGLYEGENFVRWLDDLEWIACGYNYKRESDKFILSRSPLRRFEDITNDFTNMSIQSFNEDNKISSIIETISIIKEEHKTIKPDDIAIIFLNTSNKGYQFADELAYEIRKTFNWEVSHAYLSKNKEKNKLCITNRNNIKGLEFPFIICIEEGLITSNISKRNSIYMSLTRSFISSYFLVHERNENFINTYSLAIKNINEKNEMILIEPSEENKRKQVEKIKIEANKRKKSIEDIIDEVSEELNFIDNDYIYQIKKTASMKFNNYDEQNVRDFTIKMIDLMRN